jgi:hypothetical protein
MLSFNVARFIIALPLILGAALKVYALFVHPAPGIGWLDARVTQIFLVLLETTVGIWLFGGWSPRELRICAILLYATLGVARLYFALTSETSCPCFGVLRLSPTTTLIIDLAAVTLLCVAQQPSLDVRNGRKRITYLGFANGITASLAGLFVLGAGLAAQSSVRPQPDVFQQVTTVPVAHDAGCVEQMMEITRVFTLRNSLAEPIEITDVYASCGCTTVPGMKGQVVQSAGELAFPVTLRTGADEGTRRATVIIYYRAIGQRFSAWKACTLSCSVLPEYRIFPTMVDFGEVPAGTTITRTVIFEAVNDSSAQVVSVGSSDSRFRPIVRARQFARPQTEIEVSFHAAEVGRRGPVIGNISIVTSSRKAPTSVLTLRAFVNPILEVRPTAIVIESDAPKVVRRKLRLSAPSPARVQLSCSSALVRIPESEMKVEDVKELEVVVLAPPDGTGFTDEIHVTCSSLNCAELAQRYCVRVPV